jgi:hypothetical protein
MKLFYFEYAILQKNFVNEMPFKFAQNFNKENLSEKQCQRFLDKLPFRTDRKLLTSKLAGLIISTGKSFIDIDKK